MYREETVYVTTRWVNFDRLTLDLIQVQHVFSPSCSDWTYIIYKNGTEFQICDEDNELFDLLTKCLTGAYPQDIVKE